MKPIEKILLDSYQNTMYVVHGTPPIRFYIDKFSPEMQSLMTTKSVQCVAFISAHNPYSVPTNHDTNHEMMEKMLSDINDDGFKYLSGYGTDKDEKWSESMVLIFNISKSHIIEFGNKYQQNAIVWIDSTCIPELILLR